MTIVYIGLAIITVALIAAIYLFPSREGARHARTSRNKHRQTNNTHHHTTATPLAPDVLHRVMYGLAERSPSHGLAHQVQHALDDVLIGQRGFTNAIILSLIAPGHLLVEGVPGLAKTLTLRAVARVLGGEAHRVQCTPDMLPMDIIGHEMYNPHTHTFEVNHGPVMANFLLIDEINRTTPKVQSALLEAMEEHAVTIGNQTFDLPQPFFVMATQNPLDDAGTYVLPYAQVDRFLCKIRLDYPSQADEQQMLRTTKQLDALAKVVSLDDVTYLQHNVDGVDVPPHIIERLVALAAYTRSQPDLIRVGVSPRATKALLHASQALALLSGEHTVTREMIETLLLPVWGHRLIGADQHRRAGRDSLSAQSPMTLVSEVYARFCETV